MRTLLAASMLSALVVACGDAQNPGAMSPNGANLGDAGVPSTSMPTAPSMPATPSAPSAPSLPGK